MNAIEAIVDLLAGKETCTADPNNHIVIFDDAYVNIFQLNGGGTVRINVWSIEGSLSTMNDYDLTDPDSIDNLVRDTNAEIERLHKHRT